ncbi:MAG: cardiolipin synthase, partial [Solirubrobacteraceae bacterium]|nr:cardiolipin synthase [Solirubrobacteraceae bacterium]
MDPLDILLHGTIATDIFGWIVRLAAIVVVPVNRRPSSATAWLMLIFLVPYFGLLAFFLIGNPKLPKERREKQRRVNDRILAETSSMRLVPQDDPGPTWLAPLVRMNRQLGAMPMVTGNKARLIADYDAGIHEMAQAIDEAKVFVHSEFYIFALDDTTRPYFEALERAVQRGVTVRVLFDHIGSRRVAGYKQTKNELDRIGVEWFPMLPVMPLKGKYQRPDLRNHRKLLVLDGEVAFVGSQNLIDRSYNKKANIKRGLKWHELMTRVEGPVVGGINALFLTDWFSETDEVITPELQSDLDLDATTTLECQIVPSGPGFDGENNLKLFNSLMYYAEKRISITSPYFVPDESLLRAVITASHRGVEVELFVSEIGDQWLVFHAQRSYYEVLLRAGVRIYLYPAPYILHAKHLSIDDEVSVIGSSNLDMRSFELNLESTLLVSGESFAADLALVEDGYRAISRELTLEEHMARPLPGRILDN